MEMKLNAPLIKKLREERAWSQEHLASVAELSLRTIQRIEADGNASSETRMALASALNIDIASLALPEEAHTPVAANAEPDPSPTDGGILRHALAYLLVCGGLVMIGFSRHGALTWAKWPLIGWGIALALHGFKRRNNRREVR